MEDVARIEQGGKVDYVAHESAMARMERMNKRLCALCAIAVAALAASNIAWFAYESQHEDVVTVTHETPSGNNSYFGRNGSITYEPLDWPGLEGSR